jgi:gas vesicle protein
MKSIFSVLLTTGFMLFSISSSAEGDKPCKADVQKFCKDVKPGGGRIIKCMKEHESDLSAACKGKEKEMKEHMSEAKEACKADIEKFCKDVKPGEGRIMVCLKSNEDRLSEACKAGRAKK